MKYCILIIDGASGWPLSHHEGRTSLELAHTPNLDALASGGVAGLATTVPPGMEPSSACACMSVLGYNPRVYYRGRAGIEARSMGVAWGPGEVVFRCNLVTVLDGRMASYSAGHISTAEARELVAALQAKLGNRGLDFYPGVAYRHLLKISGRENVIEASCTPPHDIPDQCIADHLPAGPGSDLLREVMEQSKAVLRDHPVNRERMKRGDLPATQVWLFWATGQLPEMPPFRQLYGLSGAMTSAVDLLNGLARMCGLEVLEIPGVTDGADNDYAAQAEGALGALERHDAVVVHVESADEAGHAGSVQQKVEAISRVDSEVVGRLRRWRNEGLRLMVLPDHPTPVPVRTHVGEPVPFLLWGPGFVPNGARRFTEAQAKATGLMVEEGHTLLGRFVAGA